MKRMRLGVRIESLGLPFRRALQEVARFGASGIQIDAVGDFSPNRLSETGCRDLRHLLRSYNLELTALNCPLRHGLDVADHLDQRIDFLRQAMSLAFELGPRLIVVPAPCVPTEDAADAGRWDLLRDVLTRLTQFGDRIGTSIALEAGLDPGSRLRDYLQTFDTGSLGVQFDPANFLLHGHDPLATVMELHGKILHVQARDARRLRANRGAEEVMLGAGDIEWLGMIASLQAIEYFGFLTVARESGTSRLNDVAQGIAFLRRLIG